MQGRRDVERDALADDVTPMAGGDQPAPLSERQPDHSTTLFDGEQTIELREEELVPRREVRSLGDVVVRREVQEAPARLEVEAQRQAVEIEHVPVGRVVSERTEPWEDGDSLVVPVYEEQLTVVKQLVMKEEIHIRRVTHRETRLFEDTVRRERLVVDSPEGAGVVHERYPTPDDTSNGDGTSHKGTGNPLQDWVRRTLG